MPAPARRGACVTAALAAASLATASAPAAEATAEGLWQTRDDRTGAPRALVEVERAEGELRGHIVALYREPGEDPDPACTRCKGELAGARVIGMTILWGFRPEDGQWRKGRVLDPENGKEYSSRVWLEEPDVLKVRGYWGPFHRTQTWYRHERGEAASAGRP